MLSFQMLAMSKKKDIRKLDNCYTLTDINII